MEGTKGKGDNSKHEPRYVPRASGGQGFCRAWNQGGYVADEMKCKNRGMHACNVDLGNGKPCWRRNHRACNHKWGH